MKIGRLQTLKQNNPVGIDKKPYFSWILESEKTNVVQTAYRIQVKAEDEVVLWDTDWVESDENSFIVYDGAPLESCTRYIVQVEAKNNYEEQADSSAYFETAFISAEEWTACWIEDCLPVNKRDKGFNNQAPATMFRKKFMLEASKEIKSARVYATAHGTYYLYVNGSKVEGRELAPGYATYLKNMPYETYDITDLLGKNENALGFYVGDGWYFSPETSMDNSITTEGHHGVIFEAHINYSDGTTDVIKSDGTVKTCYGPVLSSDMFAGESYDARKEVKGWSTADFDDSQWDNAVECDYSKDILSAETDDVITAIKLFEGKEFIVTPKGEKVIDFGQNMAGRVRINNDLPEGYKVSLVHFEALDEEGNFFNTILSTNGVGAGADQKVEYISSGENSIYEPQFTYFGFRYVLINIYDENGNEIPASEINMNNFTAVALSTKKENLGLFVCSDERINQLYSNIRWSQNSNMVSIPTDCPQREKAGWTGDAAIYIETALLNEDVTPLFSRWMENVSCDQQEDGMIPMVVPFNDTYRAMSTMMGQMVQMTGMATSAGWGDVSVKVPWMMYQITDNKEILAEQYSTMKAWCDYILAQARIRVRPDLPEEKEQYLWNYGFHYGEWLIPSTSKEGFDNQEAVGMAMAMTAMYTAPIYGHYSVSTFAKAARILGNDSDYSYYSQIAEKMKDAIQCCLIGPNGELPAEYMGAYVLLLYFDLVPKHLRKQYEEHLVEMIKANGNCLDTGFLATPYLLDTLDKIGRTDVAFDLLFQTKSPSWLYEVEHGATTIWETWNAINEDNVPQHVSLNHYSFGCVAAWMFKTLGGIRSETPGFKQIVIEPKFDERITWAKREYQTEQGLVSCRWEKNGKNVELKVTIPCNTKAVVILPDGSTENVGSGSYSYNYQV